MNKNKVDRWPILIGLLALLIGVSDFTGFTKTVLTLLLAGAFLLLLTRTIMKNKREKKSIIMEVVIGIGLAIGLVLFCLTEFVL